MYGIFGFIAFVFTYMFIHFDLFYTESDSAKYLLSALVQSQAAIIGIVITLTFITVQLIFSYSPRAVGVALKKNVDMWMLLIFYGISIFYGLFVLRMIPDKLNGHLSQIDFLTFWGSSVSLEYRICFVYCLGIFTFVAIAPYLRYTVNFLKPDNIIKILSHDIAESEILKHIKSVEEHEKDRTIPIEEDPVQPIVDIIQGSVMKYDVATTSTGINTIADRAIDVVDPYLFSISAKKSKKIKNDLRPGPISKKFKNEFKKKGYPLSGSPIVEIINFIPRTTKWRIHDENTREMYRVIEDESGELTVLIDFGSEIEVSNHFGRHFEKIGRFVISQDGFESAIEVIKSLETFGKLAADKEFEEPTRKITKSIRLIGRIAAKKREDFDGVIWQAVESLKLVGKVAITKEGEFENPATDIVVSIGMVGIAAAENEREWPTDWAVSSLEEIGEDAMGYGLAWATNRTVFSLGIVIMAATRNGMKLVGGTSQTKTIEFIEDIGKDAINKGEKFKGVANQAVWSIGGIGTTAAEGGKEFKSVAKQAAISVAEVGISAAEKGNELKSVIQHAIESLIDVGKTAAENGLDDVAMQAAQSLAELTISSEEIVKTVIQRLKQYQGYKSSEEFMNLYEQQLGKLQTRYLDTNITTKP